MSMNINLQEQIGKYLNRYGYSDVDPIGKIIGVKGKATFIVKRVVAGENKTKMKFVPGGFSAICLNDWAQEYDFHETDEIINFRVSKHSLKRVQIETKPVKYYDYNF